MKMHIINQIISKFKYHECVVTFNWFLSWFCCSGTSMWLNWAAVQLLTGQYW